jgi:hypothetical protein
MMKRFWRFNLHFVVLAAVLATACSTPEEKARKKQLAGLRIHVEGRRNVMEESPKATFRSGDSININQDIVLTDSSLASAEIVDTPGGYSLRLHFDRHGQLKLETVMLANKGRRLPIFMTWSTGKKDVPGDSRWLAAPLIQQNNASGILTFTPDASREELELIVRGLNNMVKKNNQ